MIRCGDVVLGGPHRCSRVRVCAPALESPTDGVSGFSRLDPEQVQTIVPICTWYNGLKPADCNTCLHISVWLRVLMRAPPHRNFLCFLLHVPLPYLTSWSHLRRRTNNIVQMKFPPSLIDVIKHEDAEASNHFGLHQTCWHLSELAVRRRCWAPSAFPPFMSSRGGIDRVIGPSSGFRLAVKRLICVLYVLLFLHNVP